ncbi:histidine-type phosphatase [Asticcacaulis sp. 201]|uniref:histidine-type phosphatase n=1 Tax=Asticcacaulis sp. 201 TaxID=3028787 RepID=UPI002916F660|nr:histidine-type phosphatase [Asticcacaulis sp. 201]MDV6330400.1 histidine-type phosphatase [Asticcacaulis sp. 201]
MKLERVVMLYRHGVRAPLKGEAEESLSHDAWPVWSTPESLLTPHGKEGMRLLGVYDRLWLTKEGLLPSNGCATAAQVNIWANKEERTITSGNALSEGLAPGCAVPVGHLAADAHDPLFEPVEAKAVPYDPAAALSSFKAAFGSADKLMAPHRQAVRTLEDILDCRHTQPACDLASVPGDVKIGADGRGISLTGPIDTTSGTAEVLILQYIEGLPLDQVGWGRASRARLSEISRLHGLLFDVYVRSPYMAPRVAGPMGRRILDTLTAEKAPPVTLLVGHDNNIAALAALVGVDFHIDSYGYQDMPVGGAIGFEVLKSQKTGKRYVRVIYQAQTLDQLRTLTPLDLQHPPVVQTLRMKTCTVNGQALCPLKRFTSLMNDRMRLDN